MILWLSAEFYPQKTQQPLVCIKIITTFASNSEQNDWLRSSTE